MSAWRECFGGSDRARVGELVNVIPMCLPRQHWFSDLKARCSTKFGRISVSQLYDDWRRRSEVKEAR